MDRAKANFCKRILWWAAAVPLLWTLAHTTRADQHQLSMDLMIEDQLRTDFRQHKFQAIPLETIANGDLHQRFNAFGLDNAGLERAAADLGQRRMHPAQQLLNQHWLYVSSHEFKWTPGSDIVTVYLKAKARDYWSKMMATRQQKQRAQDSHRRADKTGNRMDYDMGLDATSVEFLITYRFH